MGPHQLQGRLGHRLRVSGVFTHQARARSSTGGGFRSISRYR